MYYSRTVKNNLIYHITINTSNSSRKKNGEYMLFHKDIINETIEYDLSPPDSDPVEEPSLANESTFIIMFKVFLL